VNLLVTGRRCVVGGARGRIAARKDRVRCSPRGAEVQVVAPEGRRQGPRVGECGPGRPWRSVPSPQLTSNGAWVVVTATDVPEVNRAVFEAGRNRGASS